jgi:hypothetical protein
MHMVSHVTHVLKIKIKFYNYGNKGKKVTLSL